jgi:ankyrin repeat protein
MTAARHNRSVVVSVLLEVPGIEVNLTNREGASAFRLACIRGYTEVVSQLLAHPSTDITDDTTSIFDVICKYAEPVFKLEQRNIQILVEVRSRKPLRLCLLSHFFPSFD